MRHIEQAYEDYRNNMKYKDIAVKYDVSINTVKSWKKRYKWTREIILEDKKSVQTFEKIAPHLLPGTKKLRNRIERDLKNQLDERGATHAHYNDLVNDYLSLWDVKTMLIADIEERGVVITLFNGNEKKNDSITELNKTNAQMLKLLSELGLKATDIVKDDGEDDDY